MVLVILLAPFDLVFSLPGMLTGRISLSAPKVLEYGSEGMLAATTIRKRPFPAGRIRVLLRVSDDERSFRRRLLCEAAPESKYNLAINTSQSGVTAYQVKRIKATSLFGLFAISIAVNRRVTVLVLPAAAKPPNIVSLPRGVILRPKPGGGFAEDHELRPYRQGDAIRSIHWKISAKHDSLIIREPLVPPAHSRLVQISHWKKAKERDLILGRLRWISNYLLKWEMPYYVRISEDGPVAEITSNADLLEYLYCALSGLDISLPTPSSLPVRFMWTFKVDGAE